MNLHHAQSIPDSLEMILQHEWDSTSSEQRRLIRASVRDPNRMDTPPSGLVCSARLGLVEKLY